MPMFWFPAFGCFTVASRLCNICVCVCDHQGAVCISLFFFHPTYSDTLRIPQVHNEHMRFTDTKHVFPSKDEKDPAHVFISGSLFSAWKQLISSGHAACAASQQSISPWLALSSSDASGDHSPTPHFVLSCCHANTTELWASCHCSPQSAEMLLGCLGRATYWESDSLEPLMTSLLGSRFICWML